MSILPSVRAGPGRTFEHLYNLVGQNTGNLLFTNAVWAQIGGEKFRVNFAFDPARLNAEADALVIPAANWISPVVDFSELADLVEALTIPVVMIGVGAQDHAYSGKVDVPQGTIRFLRAVSERSASISVRGDYSALILKSLGIDRTVVTGCPSLYHDFSPQPRPPKAVSGPARLLVHSTRFSIEQGGPDDDDSVHRALYRLAFASDTDLLLQSEKEEMSLLSGADEPIVPTERMKSDLAKSYGASNWDALNAFLGKRARLFYDVQSWARAMADYDYVIGSRLHGTIMALNSGTVGALIAHDSRTREVSEFAGIPRLKADLIKKGVDSVLDALGQTDVTAYHDKRRHNRTIYEDFLRTNGLIVAPQ